MRGSRALALLALLLSPISLSGCFVFDEIDKGMEIMDAHTPAANKKKQKEEVEAAQGEKPPTYQQAVESWWKDAKSLSLAPGDAEASDDPVVPCTHEGKQVFTKQSDCIARGGTPG